VTHEHSRQRWDTCSPGIGPRADVSVYCTVPPTTPGATKGLPPTAAETSTA
jgi:hypothetical protein